MSGRKQASLQSMATKFMRLNRAAMLSVVTEDGKPHASIVYCLAGDDLSIYFTTRAEGKKFECLVTNPEVCMLFSGHNTLQQLQLSGKAKRITDIDRELDLLHELMKLRYEDERLPRPTVNLVEPGTRKEYALFQVTPYEMTFADFKTCEKGKFKSNFVNII